MSDFLNNLTGGLGSGLASSALNAVSGLWNDYNTRRAEERQFEYQQQLMAMQNQYQMSNWNAQFDKINEYNSPMNQINRMKDAGINVNSALGNGITGASASSAGMGSVAPGAVGANVGNVDLSAGDPVGKGLSGYLLGTQIKAIEADTDAKIENTRGQRIQNDIEEATSPVKKQIPGKELELIGKNIESVIKDIDNKELQNNYQKWVNETLNPLIEKGEIEKINQMQQSIEESKARVSEINNKIDEIKENIKKIKADTAKSWSEKSLIDKQAEGLGYDNEIKEATKEYEKKLKELEKEKADLEMQTFRKLGFVPTGSEYVDAAKFLAGDNEDNLDIIDRLCKFVTGFTPYEHWNNYQEWKSLRSWKQRQIDKETNKKLYNNGSNYLPVWPED